MVAIISLALDLAQLGQLDLYAMAWAIIALDLEGRMTRYGVSVHSLL